MLQWELFDTTKYFGRSTDTSFGSDREDAITMPVGTARGCAFRCTFCHFVFWDDPYRYRDTWLVMEETRRSMEAYDANYF